MLAQLRWPHGHQNHSRHGESAANALMNDFARKLGYEGKTHNMIGMSNVERAYASTLV